MEIKILDEAIFSNNKASQITMKKFQTILVTLVFGIFCICVSAQIKKESSEKKTLADYFLVERDKPSVYIKFEKSGMAEPLFRGDSKERYWLRLFNNTKGRISFCSFNVVQQYGEVGIVYNIKENFDSTGDSDEPEPPKVKTTKDVEIESSKINQKKVQESSLKESNVPQGYSTGDVCHTFYLSSGASILFSIPKGHLVIGSRTFYFETQFKYEWEESGTEIAGHPLHLVSFSFGNLPFSERKGP